DGRRTQYDRTVDETRPTVSPDGNERYAHQAFAEAHMTAARRAAVLLASGRSYRWPGGLSRVVAPPLAENATRRQIPGCASPTATSPRPPTGAPPRIAAAARSGATATGAARSSWSPSSSARAGSDASTPSAARRGGGGDRSGGGKNRRRSTSATRCS